MKTQKKKSNQMYQGFRKEITPHLETLAGDADGRKHEQAIDKLSELPLSVETTKHYNILLSYGGPASRIVGKLDSRNEPETATFEAQNWGTPWTAADDQDENMLLQFARLFYFTG